MSVKTRTYTYHIRNTKGEKIIGGMIHAENLEDAAERVTHGFSATISQGGGRNIFVRDKDGIEVSIYLSVLPEYTERGQRELAAERQKRAEKRRKEQEEAEALEEALEQKIEELGGAKEALDALNKISKSEE